MTTSLQPLSDIERRLFVAGLNEHRNHPGRPFAEVIYRTGIHPAALSRPWEFDLHWDGENLRWTRPKNRDPMKVRAEPSLASWFPSWWERDFKAYCTRHIYRMVLEFGHECHITGLGPRSLRHTFIWRLAQKFPPDEVARVAGCTVTQAIDYCRLARTKTDEDIGSAGLPD